MVFSVCDIELMRLLWWCGNMMPDSLCAVFDEEIVRNLMSAGLIHIHKSSGSLCLTAKGRRSLSGVNCQERTPLSYRKDLIQRRLRVSDTVLTGYRAGMNLSVDATDQAAKSPTLFLPSFNRGKEQNIWGSSRVAVLLRLGGCCYGAYSIYPNVGRLNLADEERTLSVCAARSQSRHAAFFLAGDTYRTVLSELERADVSGDGRLISYGEAWKKTNLPVHLLSHDDTGALQLRIMAQPDYRQRLAWAGLGSGYTLPPSELPHCDGLLRGVPFVIAADMELHRLDAALEETRQVGFSQIAAIALKGQVRDILRERYKDRMKLFAITKETLTAAFGDELPLCRPGYGVFLTERGDAINVPPIQTNRKAGRPG